MREILQEHVKILKTLFSLKWVIKVISLLRITSQQSMCCIMYSKTQLAQPNLCCGCTSMLFCNFVTSRKLLLL